MNILHRSHTDKVKQSWAGPENVYMPQSLLSKYMYFCNLVSKNFLYKYRATFSLDFGIYGTLNFCRLEE